MNVSSSSDRTAPAPVPAASAPTPATVATRIELGPRDEQQDRVKAVRDNDESWVIAVADGLGGHVNGAAAAEAAISAVPDRIAGPDEMRAAFRAANTAVRQVPRGIRRHGFDWSHLPMTTLTVAAWTAETGLCAAWVGDSPLYLIGSSAEQNPTGASLPWACTPHGGWITAAVDRTLGWHDNLDDLDPAGSGDSIAWLPDRIARRYDTAADTGIAVIAATDGLHGALLDTEPHQAWTVAELLADHTPDPAQGDAADIAEALIAVAREHGLTDNTAVAVAAAAPSADT